MMNYFRLRAILELPRERRAGAITEAEKDITDVIAKGVMGWQLVGEASGGHWGAKGNEKQFCIRCEDYRPLRDIRLGLAAADQMISRQWSFKQDLSGRDYALVDVYNLTRGVYLNVLIWDDSRARHALALALAVAMAWLAEQELIKREQAVTEVVR